MKEFEFVPVAVIAKELVNKSTGKPYNMYNCTFKTNEGFDFQAVAFSSTIAEDLEKAIAEKRKVKIECEVKESAYGTQYTVKSVDGKAQSNFGPRGKGMQKDQVGIERSVAAKIAGDWLNINAQTEKDFKKWFKTIAEEVYVWVSARPSAPIASGGPVEQAPPHTDLDAPIDLNDMLTEYR